LVNNILIINLYLKQKRFLLHSFTPIWMANYKAELKQRHTQEIYDPEIFTWAETCLFKDYCSGQGQMYGCRRVL